MRKVKAMYIISDQIAELLNGGHAWTFNDSGVIRKFMGLGKVLCVL